MVPCSTQLYKICRNVGEAVSVEEVTQKIAEVDTDKSGTG
jgi:Ca2+-binding EF-hand superfamily protein